MRRNVAIALAAGLALGVCIDPRWSMPAPSLPECRIEASGKRGRGYAPPRSQKKRRRRAKWSN